MSRALMCVFVFLFLVFAPSLARSQLQSLDELHRQAEDAYCSRDFAKAIELSLVAAELAKPDLAREAEQIGRLAGASEKLRDYVGAERYYAQLLQNYEQQYGKDSLNSAFAMEALARILVKNGKIDEAEALFKRVPPARSREISQWAKEFDVSGVEVPDVFKPRHHANAALIALQRRQWRTAFNEYQQSIESIDENVAQMESGDSLADLSSERNNATFVGLARAAWELNKEPGADAGALLGKSFEAAQRKWRTAAALALQKAAERVPRVGPTGAPLPVRRLRPPVPLGKRRTARSSCARFRPSRRTLRKLGLRGGMPTRPTRRRGTRTRRGTGRLRP